MRITKLFDKVPNPQDKGMQDYYKVVKQPICFEESKYSYVCVILDPCIQIVF